MVIVDALPVVVTEAVAEATFVPCVVTYATDTVYVPAPIVPPDAAVARVGALGVVKYRAPWYRSTKEMDALRTVVSCASSRVTAIDASDFKSARSGGQDKGDLSG